MRFVFLVYLIDCADTDACSLAVYRCQAHRSIDGFGHHTGALPRVREDRQVVETLQTRRDVGMRRMRSCAGEKNLDHKVTCDCYHCFMLHIALPRNRQGYQVPRRLRDTGIDRRIFAVDGRSQAPGSVFGINTGHSTNTFQLATSPLLYPDRLS